MGETARLEQLRGRRKGPLPGPVEHPVVEGGRSSGGPATCCSDRTPTGTAGRTCTCPIGRRRAPEEANETAGESRRSRSNSTRPRRQIPTGPAAFAAAFLAGDITPADIDRTNYEHTRVCFAPAIRLRAALCERRE